MYTIVHLLYMLYSYMHMLSYVFVCEHKQCRCICMRVIWYLCWIRVMWHTKHDGRKHSRFRVETSQAEQSCVLLVRPGRKMQTTFAQKLSPNLGIVEPHPHGKRSCTSKDLMDDLWKAQLCKSFQPVFATTNLNVKILKSFCT